MPGMQPIHMLQPTSPATVLRREGEDILVRACGRTCNVPFDNAGSLGEVASVLQRQLNLQEQSFEICDINGTLLQNEMQLQQALSSGLTPLSATLTDKSLHTLETQREELGQMQWKLVRDQLSSSTSQMASLARQMSEMQFQLQNNMRETQNLLGLCREDLYKAIDSERQAVKEDMTVLSDSVNAAISVMTGEKSKREMAVQGFEKHLHGVCDMLDSERQTRRQDMAMHMTILQELRTKVDSEKERREILDDKMREVQDKTQQVRDDLMAKLENQMQSSIRVKGEFEVVFAEMRARFNEIEDRCGTIENNMAESSSWHAANVERLGERHERVAETLGSIRLADATNAHQIKSMADSIQDLDVSMKDTERELRDLHVKERQFREDHIMRTHKSLLSDQTRQVSELEKRLNLRLQEESTEREKSYQWLCDELSSMIADGKHREYPKKSTGKREADASPDPAPTGMQGGQSPRAIEGLSSASQQVPTTQSTIFTPQTTGSITAPASANGRPVLTHSMTLPATPGSLSLPPGVTPAPAAAATRSMYAGSPRRGSVQMGPVMVPQSAPAALQRRGTVMGLTSIPQQPPPGAPATPTAGAATPQQVVRV